MVSNCCLLTILDYTSYFIRLYQIKRADKDFDSLSAQGSFVLISFYYTTSYFTIVYLLNSNLGGKVHIGTFQSVNGAKQIDIGFKPTFLMFFISKNTGYKWFQDIKNDGTTSSGAYWIDKNNVMHVTRGWNESNTSIDPEFTDNGFIFKYDAVRYVQYIAIQKFEDNSELLSDTPSVY